ncbi:MAG: response regulator containing a CheY-like receiver domain and an DNA-binding domain [Acidimicrobiales bacterium]|nr:response regulator containing a CheY-like receiver domain and an DNA-binding domain [Acidimicrobiales bacterium]
MGALRTEAADSPHGIRHRRSLERATAERRQRVLVIDDDRIMAEALQMAMQQAGWADVQLVTPVDADNIVDAAVNFRPSVIALDLNLGIAGSSASLVSRLVALGCAVVIVTADDDSFRLEQAIAAGAVEVVDKTQGLEVLLSSLADALEQHHSRPQADPVEVIDGVRHRRRSGDAERAALVSLTQRERAVLGGLIEGLQAEAIAGTHFVSVSTVRTQIASLLQKLGVSSQLAAVAIAHRAGWSATVIDLSDETG